MKREIKYRGKDIENNQEWRIGSLIENPDGECIIVLFDKDWNELSYDVDTDTVGQFTGLRDGKGKEIYEGDVVSSGTTIGVVVYNCSEACYVVERERSIELKFYASIGIEVIGNIHDNPEMV